MLDNRVKVDLPEKGIVKVHTGGMTYVQYTVCSAKTKAGKPTGKRVVIGKLDEESGKLIPNRNYYELFGEKQEDERRLIRSCGCYHAVSTISDSLGLTKLLQQVFPDKWEQILTVAQYMAAEGNVMYYLPDFCENHRTFGDCKPSSETASRLFSSITPEDMLLFFHSWKTVKKDNEFIAYDVTSFSSYSQGIRSLEWGYNRDKEKLPQINLGMYYGEESKLPLYYRAYPGSISDKAHLRYMVEDNELLSGSGPWW